MKKKIFNTLIAYGFTITSITIIPVSADASPIQSSAVYGNGAVFTVNNNHQSIYIKRGSNFSIDLDQNGSIGQYWKLEEPTNGNVSFNTDYMIFPTNANNLPLGRAYPRRFEFTAHDSGKTSYIGFTYTIPRMNYEVKDSYSLIINVVD